MRFRCILEILDERLGAFHAEVMAIIGPHTLSFWEFCAYGALAFQGERDPIVSRRLLAYVAKAFRMSFCPEEAKVRYAFGQLKDRA